MRSFKIYSRKQANKHIYTHVCNAVPVVWGSLRLAPIINKGCHAPKFCTENFRE